MLNLSNPDARLKVSSITKKKQSHLFSKTQWQMFHQGTMDFASKLFKNYLQCNSDTFMI